MTSEPGSGSKREQRLTAVIAAYMEATKSGRSPDHQELLKMHPDLATDLREQESPELRKHTQDRSNFQFQASGDDLTDELLTELAGLAKTCLDRMKKDRRA